MSTQHHEALRLADWLFDNVEHMNHADAAAELRRLHALNDALEVEAKRYRAIRAGLIYIEHINGEIYMADDDGGKYYQDPRDMDMDIDAAIAKTEGREA